MTLTRYFAAAALAATAMLALPASSAQAGTVVAASGPSASQYPVGTQVSDTQRISLRQGDSLTVLDKAGTRVLRGPGTFVLARQSGQARNRAFASLTTNRAATRARTGAVRPVYAEEKSNPNLWYVDVDASGTICLVNPNSVKLWRSDTSKAASYSIASLTGSSETVEVNFPEKEMLGQWTAALQLREGQNYTISEANGAKSAQVNFVFLETAPNDAEELAQLLIANGCSVQLGQLAKATLEN